jgi:hypothetical protein
MIVIPYKRVRRGYEFLSNGTIQREYGDFLQIVRIAAYMESWMVAVPEDLAFCSLETR